MECGKSANKSYKEKLALASDTMYLTDHNIVAGSKIEQDIKLTSKS